MMSEKKSTGSLGKKEMPSSRARRGKRTFNKMRGIASFDFHVFFDPMRVSAMSRNWLSGSWKELDSIPNPVVAMASRVNMPNRDFISTLPSSSPTISASPPFL